MNNKVTIKNFRVFDQEGVTVDVKPITILTGCNSSGKSSIIKAICLLNDYIKKSGLNYSKYFNFDFTKRPYSLLGGFSKIINDKSSEKVVTFQYRIHSLMLGGDVDIEYVFENSDKEIGNVCLKSLRVRDIDGNILCHAFELNKDIDPYYDPYYDPKGSFRMPVKVNYSLLKHVFIRFAEIQVKMNALFKYYEKKRSLNAKQYLEKKRLSKDHSIEDFKPIFVEEEFDKYVSLLETTDDMDEVEKTLIECHKEIVKECSEQVWQDALTWFHEYSSFYPTISHLDEQKRFVMERVKGKRETPFCFDKFGSNFEMLKDTGCISNFAQEVVKNNMSEDDAFSKLLEYADDEIDIKTKFRMSVYTEFKKKVAEKSECSYDEIPKLYRGLPMNEVKDIRDKYNHIIEFLSDSYKHSSYDNFVDFIKNLENKIINICYSLDDYLDADCNFSVGSSNDEIMIFSSLFGYESWLYKFKGYHPELISSFVELFSTFCNYFCKEIFIMEMPEPIYYVGSDVVDVKRFYPVESNDIFTNLIKDLYNKENSYSYIDDLHLMPVNSLVGKIPTLDFINKWLKEFNICDHFKIELVAEGAGWMIRLYKNKDDKEGSILADSGYGITQLFTLIVSIGLAKPLQTIAVEEPEIHLHPSFQSKLAEMFVEAHSIYNAHFIIETHSEYLIRKLQTLVASKKINSKEISLLYVYDADKEKRPLYAPQVQLIDINPDGSLNGDFGTGFFDEADNLSMSLFLKQR